MTPNRDLGIAALLFAGALALRAAAIALFAFDGLYGQDSFAYLHYSLDLRRALAAGELPPPFLWPLGYPLLVALALSATANAAAAAQWVSAVGGALLAPLVYAIVRELRPQQRSGAVVAGLLAATAPQLMVSSVSVMSDAAALAWIALSAWALVRHQRALGVPDPLMPPAPERSAAPPLALAAFAFVMALATRWAYLPAAPVWAASALLAWGAAGLPLRRRIAYAALAVAIALPVFGAQFAGGLVQGRLSHVGNFHVAGWDPAVALRSHVITSDGMFDYPVPIAIYYLMPLVHPSFVFPLLSVFVAVGAGALWRGAASVTALVLGWPLLMYLYLAGRPWENPRFSLALFPPLLVLLGVGFERAVGAAPTRWRHAALAGAGLALAGSLAWGVRGLARFVAVKDAHLAAVRWVEAATPADATIISFGLTEMLAHYTPRPVLNLYALDQPALQAMMMSRRPFLLVDPDNIDAQWRGRSPARNLEWLRSHAGLTEVGRRPPWILFRIDPRGG